MEIKRGRSKAVTGIVVLFVLAVLIAGGTLGYFWYRKANQAEQTSSSPGGSISLNTNKKVETESLQVALAIAKATDKPGDLIKLSVLGIDTPKTWRTVNAKSLLNTPLDSVYATSANDILAQLIMVPERDPTDRTQTLNNLSFYNITSWLAKSSMGTGGTVTPATKMAYVSNIKNIGEGKPADKKACDKGYGILNEQICGDLLKGKPIASKDGKLKGIAFLNQVSTDKPTYDPQVLVFMTGQVKDQQLFAYGAFHLLDTNSHTLNTTDTEAIKAAWDSFVKGGVPTDTMELYQHVIDAVQSISIQTSE